MIASEKDRLLQWFPILPVEEVVVNFSFDILDIHGPIDSLQLHRMANRISLSLSHGSYNIILQNAQPYHGALPKFSVGVCTAQVSG